MVQPAAGTKSWGYTKNEVFGSARRYLCELVDTVSKNGNFLLNIGPMADGTIPNEVQEILEEMGQWLERNGEAVYNTRPWRVFGEGPNIDRVKGEFSDEIKYSSRDIRYTRSKNGAYVYAIVMGKPKEEEIFLSEYHEFSRSIELLGFHQKLEYTVLDGKLKISLRNISKMIDNVFVIKIESLS